MARLRPQNPSWVLAGANFIVAVVISENEFVAPDLYCNMGLVHETEKFEKHKICSEIEAVARLRPQNPSWVLAGANFIALRRAHVLLQVTRRAVVRRVIPLPG